MIELPSLHPHQEDLRDRTRAALKKHGRVILTAPPGMGKTRTAKWILGASALREKKDNQSGRSLFAVHRRGLVDNASDSFNEEPALSHAVIMSGVKPKYGARVQVASIETLLSWFTEDGKYSTNITFDLIIVDETHSHLPKFQKFLELHDAKRAELGQHAAYVIGLTATPRCKGLADVYREIVQGPSTQWLIDNKFLAPFRYVRATQGKLGLLIKKGNEFTKDSAALAMEGLAGDLVRDWKRFAEGRPTVGFFPRRSHARDAMEQLTEAGLRVEYVDGETEDITRRRIFWQLNNGELDYICNVRVLERGTDIPRIGCVQLCVAIGSVVTYRQVVGRGSRIHPEKTDCLILDHGGNVHRHGLFEDDPMWSLDQSKGKVGEVTARPTIECPQCQAIYRGGACRSCGYEPTKQERKAQSLEFDGTELKEITAEERVKSKRRVKRPEDLMASVLFAAGRSGRTWKQAMWMFFRASEEQGTSYRIPLKVTIAEREYYMVPKDSPDSGRKIQDLYPITNGGGHGGEYCQKQTLRGR